MKRMLSHVLLVPVRAIELEFATVKQGMYWWGFKKDGETSNLDLLRGHPMLKTLREPMPISDFEKVYRSPDGAIYIAHSGSKLLDAKKRLVVRSGDDLLDCYDSEKYRAARIGEHSNGTKFGDWRRVQVLRNIVSGYQREIGQSCLPLRIDDQFVLQELERELNEFCDKYGVPFNRNHCLATVGELINAINAHCD